MPLDPATVLRTGDALLLTDDHDHQFARIEVGRIDGFNSVDFQTLIRGVNMSCSNFMTRMATTLPAGFQLLPGQPSLLVFPSDKPATQFDFAVELWRQQSKESVLAISWPDLLRTREPMFTVSFKLTTEPKIVHMIFKGLSNGLKVLRQEAGSEPKLLMLWPMG